MHFYRRSMRRRSRKASDWVHLKIADFGDALANLNEGTFSGLKLS